MSTALEWKVCSNGTVRTSVTALSDDEVVICDALFDRHTTVELLAADNFSDIMNLPYDVQTKRSDIPGLLSSMCDRGILRAWTDVRFPSSAYVELTEQGGDLWERERQPAWSSWLCSRTEDVNGELLKISAGTAKVAERYLGVGIDVGLFRVADSAPEWKTENAAMIASRWKRGHWVTLTIPLVGTRFENRQPDWEQYESRRIWWKSVPELLASHRALTALLRGQKVWPPDLSAG